MEIEIIRHSLENTQRREKKEAERVIVHINGKQFRITQDGDMLRISVDNILIVVPAATNCIRLDEK